MITIDLSGRTAVVTGGGQGLGAGMCQQLSRAGADVVVNYFEEGAGENRRRAEKTAAALGGSAIALEADVRNAEQVARMFDEAISRFGRLDMLVNNAGVLCDRTIKKMTYDEWQLVIGTNLTGVFTCCKEAAERLADEGRIVNISSLSGQIGIFGQSNYSASKAGVMALTKVLSKELAKRKITVNAIAPGIVPTEMGESIPEQFMEKMLAQIPLGRLGKPEEIANVVLFLCSDLASYVTGQVLHVNGGWIG